MPEVKTVLVVNLDESLGKEPYHIAETDFDPAKFKKVLAPRAMKKKKKKAKSKVKVDEKESE